MTDWSIIIPSYVCFVIVNSAIAYAIGKKHWYRVGLISAVILYMGTFYLLGRFFLDVYKKSETYKIDQAKKLAETNKKKEVIKEVKDYQSDKDWDWFKN